MRICTTLISVPGWATADLRPCLTEKRCQFDETGFEVSPQVKNNLSTDR
ncbi:hypothetical protein MA3A0930S_3685 [Mycobacteroides abscessus 3A-0930-S]|nr:hypothetical protein MA3A0930S_3685 [Mycobacteroides abscessus 3A-0930-S]EIV59563.1 hypothetical protein MA4S0116S_2460 [Mycobacteroides abscessus 4S-0116-S]EIV76010.1 hypothetical protein MM3A0810R_3788 [Mycobacteroides abscessus 3A-0810-R]